MVGGEVVFGTGAATAPPPPGIPTEPQPRVDESALRWAGLALLALLTGSLVLRALGAARCGGSSASRPAVPLPVRRRSSRCRPRPPGSLSVVLRSGAGHAALVMAPASSSPLALARRRPRLAVVAATAAAAGLALGSHAAALGAVPMLVIAVHLGCASLWAGTVVAAAIAVRRQAAAGLLRRLAPVLAPAVAGLAATGLLALGRHVVNVDALLTSTYGQVILAKTGLLLAAGAMAIAGRAALTAGRPGRVRRSIAVEATLLLLALGGAALLAAGAPARGPQFAPPAQAAASVIETRQLDDLIVSVEVKPNRPGPELRRDPRHRHPPACPCPDRRRAPDRARYRGRCPRQRRERVAGRRRRRRAAGHAVPEGRRRPPGTAGIDRRALDGRRRPAAARRVPLARAARSG